MLLCKEMEQTGSVILAEYCSFPIYIQEALFTKFNYFFYKTVQKH